VADIEGVRRPDGGIAAWQAQVLAHFDTGGVSIGGTKYAGAMHLRSG
jgi:hypothetical protein